MNSCRVIFDPLGNVAKKSTPPPPPPVGGTKGVELIYNARGLVTVYVTWFNLASGKRESLNYAASIEKVGGVEGGRAVESGNRLISRMWWFSLSHPYPCSQASLPQTSSSRVCVPVDCFQYDLLALSPGSPRQ